MEAAERAGLAFRGVIALLLAGCAGPPLSVSETAVTHPEPLVAAAPPIVELSPPQTEAPPTPQAASRPAQLVAIACSSPAMQGGALLCRAAPHATLTLNGEPAAIADASGLALIGLSRTLASPVRVAARPLPTPEQPGTFEVFTSVDVQPRTDTVSTFPMECSKIAAQTPAEKRHAEVSWVKKDAALRIFSQPVAPFALTRPAEGPYSSPFGAVRTYVPKKGDCEGSTSVHNGQDIAIPVGTEIRAPMAGTVILADPDLYYEGGAVFLDLGRGLVSITMHMSRIDVKPGDIVAQGQVLGLSGATGRVTGPHLHWALKHRNEVKPEDRSADIWLDPVLMLQLQPPNASTP